MNSTHHAFNFKQTCNMKILTCRLVAREWLKHTLTTITI